MQESIQKPERAQRALVVEADLYTVKLRFKRLFADPAIFEDQKTAVQRYLFPKTPERPQTPIYQITDVILPTDESGKTPGIAGTARYVHEKRVVRSEYLENVAISLAYVDFGSGLQDEDHKRLWKREMWGQMSFRLEDIRSEHLKIEIPPLPELYEMVSGKADPTALVDVELPDIPEKMFRPTLEYLESRLKQLAAPQHQTIEFYVARDLLPEEKQALEKRLARPAKESTIYILLSKTAEHAAL